MYDTKFFPQAIFHLEQSVEKATKSLGLWAKAITIAEARGNIGHRSIKVYFRIFQKVKDSAKSLLPDWKDLQEKFPKLRGPFPIPGKAQIELLERESGNLEREMLDDQAGLVISSNIYHLLNILDKIENLMTRAEITFRRIDNDLRRLNNGDNKVLEEMRRSVYRLFEDRMSARGIEPIEGKRMIDELVTPEKVTMQAKGLKRIARLNICGETVFWMCLILTPHVARTRYPIADLNPLEYYNSDMPLVNLFHDFVAILEKALQGIEIIYAEVPDYPIQSDS